jgi:predicted metal-binding membrane protein
MMLILVAVGVMNILAMAALTIVIFAEKLFRHGLLIARLTVFLSSGQQSLR